MAETETFFDLDSRWDFDDPALSEIRFREFLAANQDPDLQAEGVTQLARSLGLQKKFWEAMEQLDSLEGRELSARSRVRFLLERGRVLNSSGHQDRAEPFFVQAWDLARECGEDGLAVDAAHMVAIVKSDNGAVEWNEKALELSGSSADPKARKWRASLLNNLAWTYHYAGDDAKALPMFEEARQLREESGDVSQERIARYCIGRCLRTLGRVQEALDIQLNFIKDLDGKGMGFGEEEAGECLLLLGREDEARPWFKAAHEKMTQTGAIEGEHARLERIRKLAEGA